MPFPSACLLKELPRISDYGLVGFVVRWHTSKVGVQNLVDSDVAILIAKWVYRIWWIATRQDY